MAKSSILYQMNVTPCGRRLETNDSDHEVTCSVFTEVMNQAGRFLHRLLFTLRRPLLASRKDASSRPVGVGVAFQSRRAAPATGLRVVSA